MAGRRCGKVLHKDQQNVRAAVCEASLSHQQTEACTVIKNVNSNLRLKSKW